MMDFVVLGILLLLFGAIVAMSLKLYRSTRGWIRLLALAPAIVLVGEVLFVAASIALDPASHNLWPLEIFLWSIAVAAVLAASLLVRWLVQRLRRQRA